MSPNEEAFHKRLLETFRIEAADHLKAMAATLFDMERTEAPSERAGLVETAFREAHSLKGAARAVNASSIETTCQSLESVLSAVKRGETALSPAVLEAMNRAVSGLETLYAAVDFGQSEVARTLVLGLTRQLEGALHGAGAGGDTPRPASVPEAPPAPPAPPALPAPPAAAADEPAALPAQPPAPPIMEKAPVAETVRIATGKLDAILYQAEELVSAKLSAAQLCTDLRAMEAALRLEKRKADRLRGRAATREPGPASPTDTHDPLAGFDLHVNRLADAAASHQHALSLMVDRLLDDTKKAAMQAFSSLLDMFPRLARDLARDQGKQVSVMLHGADIEVDRRILEAMKDPLIHAIRNCIDHGIETPKERVAAGKPAAGTIRIAISPRGGGKVEIAVADDGRGIDLDKVRSSAVSLGLLSADKAQALDDDEAAALIFESGMTTTPIITDMSGRGLGLAILREKADKLGGKVRIETRRQAGATLRIVLPLSLATFRGVLIQTGERSFICPTLHVERVLRIRHGQIRTVEGRETIEIDGKVIALARLGEALRLTGAPAQAARDDPQTVILLRYADIRIGFAVDRVLTEQEFLVKSLGSQPVRTSMVAGATVLGDGRLIPVLNVADLVQSSSRVAPGPVAAAAPHEHRSALVVEDSITTRTLLKNILESNGWQVRTAVDGAEALAMLQTRPADVVVSDVDMPRMNGFELTTRIRAHPRLSDLPVVLVTALASREDKERGIDAGANAYLVKSGFDQGELIDIMRRLA